MKRYIYFSIIAFIFFMSAPDVFAGWTTAYAPATFNSKDCSNQEAPADTASYNKLAIDASNVGWTNFVNCMTNLGFKGRTLEKDGGVLYGGVSIISEGRLQKYTFDGSPDDTAKGAFCRGSLFYADWTRFFGCIALPSRTIFFSKKVFVPPPQPPKQYSLNIYTEGNGQGFITGPNISCGDKCQAFYDAGTVVNLTAFPDINSYSYFVSWSGVNCGGWDYSQVRMWYSSSCNVLMLEDKSVTARFSSFTIPPPPLSYFSLEVKKTGSGVVSGLGINCGSVCSVSYNQGTQITLAASPSSDSVFSGWGGDCSGIGDCVVNFNGNNFVTAQFDFSAPASSGAGPEGITGSDGASKESSAKTFSLSVDKTGPVVGLVKGDGIYCGNDCFENYPSGTKVTLTASYSFGAKFDGWSGACSGQGQCVITMDSSKSVTAKFKYSSASDFIFKIKEILPF